ncbi:MAG: 16S rRNA (cytosine(1402)-N(4))-methyltransferase RsmH [Pseudomonadota bacterium]
MSEKEARETANDARAGVGAAEGAALSKASERHQPVLLNEVLQALEPIEGGMFLDGTFGAGGYARGLLERGAALVIGVDQDPEALDAAAAWAPLFGARLRLRGGLFSDLDAIAAAEGVAEGLDGVALDIGVSSMQLDQAARGFSFLRDGPLDMRMGAEGVSAAELVAEASEGALADILFHLGEERAARRVARAIVAARAAAPIETTARLAEIIEQALPRPKPGQARIHAATRSFQALRISVNNELGELARGLSAAERALKRGGRLAVVSFHSLEDRIVKRFLAERAGRAAKGSRHEPEINRRAPSFALIKAGARAPGPEELTRNPRARSAKLRAATRSAADPWPEPPSPQAGLDAAAVLATRRR